MNKTYKILVDGREIGTTQLEKADAPMGVVFGEMKFSREEEVFDFLLFYCQENNVSITDYPETNFFQTHQSIAGLKVLNPQGVEVQGVGNQLTMAKNETSEISIQGISYPFYEEEFPHHVKAYNEMFEQ